MLAKIDEFLTPVRRKALYKLGVIGFAALVAFGLISFDQMTAFSDAVVTASGVLGVLLNLMADRNVEQ